MWRKAHQHHVYECIGSFWQQLYHVRPQSGREGDTQGEARLETKQRQ